MVGAGKISILLVRSFVDLHRFDAGPDRGPTFHSDAEPDADPIPSYFTCWKKSEEKLTSIHISASLHCLQR